MAMFGQDDRTEGVDETVARRAMSGFDALILGRKMFAPSRGDWPDDDWKGWRPSASARTP